MSTKIYLDDTIDLAAQLLLDKENGADSVLCVAKYEIAMELIKDLAIVSDGELNISYINIEPEFFNGYDKEYYCTITDEGLFVEKAFQHGTYYADDSKRAYILQECDPSIINQLDTEDEFIFNVSFDCEEELLNGYSGIANDFIVLEDSENTFRLGKSDNDEDCVLSFYSDDPDEVKFIKTFF